MREQVVLPEPPRLKRELAALEEELPSIPLTGRPLALRARNFSPSPEAYLAISGGPLAYMVRLREIERYVETLRGGARRLLARPGGGDTGLRCVRACLAGRGRAPDLRRGERSHRSPQPLVSRGVAAAHGSANRRLRARQRTRLPAPSARRRVGAGALSRRALPRARRLNCAPAPPRRREWRHDAQRARGHDRRTVRARARCAPPRALRDSRLPARRAPARARTSPRCSPSSSRPR